MSNPVPLKHEYFVDEAGDLTVFDRRGRVIVGTPGVSKCFVVGAALIHDPNALAADLESLRGRLLADPYFAAIPSMSADRPKTALLFHAKDDIPEVRREVYALLRRHEVEVFAAFRRKQKVAAELRAQLDRNGTKRGTAFIYEELVTSIFKDRLHIADSCHIAFARRGKSNRNLELTEAIAHAKYRFRMRWKKDVDKPTHISSSTPSETVCLQVIDYFLWALQRMLERGESRYFDYVAPAFRLVLDRDDDRRSGAGEYYTSRSPLTLERMMPVS